MDKFKILDNSFVKKIEHYIDDENNIYSEIEDATVIDTRIKYPFTLEQLIIYIVEFLRDKRFFFVIEVRDIRIMLNYGGKNLLNVRVFNWDQNLFDKLDGKADEIVYLHKSTRIFVGEMEKIVDETLVGDLKLSDLRVAFDPTVKPNKYQKQYKSELINIISSIYEEFSISVKQFPLLRKYRFKSGDSVRIKFQAKDERENWDNKSISILFDVEQANRDEIYGLLPNILEFENYFLLKMKVISKIIIDKQDIIINFSLLYQVITRKAYWATIGFFQTRHDNLCEKDTRYTLKELLEWAKEWNIKGNKTKICKKLQQQIYELRWNDVKDMIE